jgi:cell division protein FtsL
MKQPVRKFKETVEIRTQVLYRIRSHRYYPAALLVFVLMLAASIHIWQRVQVIALVKEAALLRAENSSLIDDATKYEAEIASLMTASRIMAYARDTLGMCPVSAEKLFTLVSKEKAARPAPDELAMMKQALDRITEHLPTLTENQAAADDSRRKAVDSLLRTGGRR